MRILLAITTTIGALFWWAKDGFRSHLGDYTTDGTELNEQFLKNLIATIIILFTSVFIGTALSS